MHNNPDIARRDKLEDFLNKNMRVESTYLTAVMVVNDVLRSMNIGLSCRAYGSIINNISAVNLGQRTEASSSMRECMAFSMDFYDSVKRRQWTNALASATGMTMNGLGSTLYFANYDRERLSEMEKALYDNFHL